MSNARSSTIEQWLKTLKNLKPAERAKVLVAQFARIEFNQLDIDVRFSLVNELITVFSTLTDESEHPLKSDEVALGMVRSLRHLHRVSESFKIDTPELLDAGIAQIDALALTVRNCHLNYLATPKGVWASIHNTYDVVSRSYRRMRQPADEHSKLLANRYRQILLFERLGPAKLLAHEQIAMWQLLDLIAPQLPLMVGAKGELLNTTGDTAFIDGDETGLRINTSRVTDIIARLGLSAEQSDKLASLLSQRPARAETRSLTNARLKICLGLNSIHQVLSKGMPFSQFTKHAPNPASLNATSFFPGADPVAQFEPVSTDELFTWGRVADRSKQGLKIVTESVRTPTVRANDIALCQTLKGDQFCALVRWLKQDNNDQYAGMQVTHHAQAVAVSISAKLGTNSEWMPALLLGGGRAIVMPYSLLPEQPTIWVYGAGYFQRWRSTSIVSSTGSQMYLAGNFVQI